MEAITALVRGSRRVTVCAGPFATQTEPKAVSTLPGDGMAIDVTEPGAGVALDVAMGLPAGVCVAALQASSVTRHEEITPILTPLLAVLLVILISFARADRRAHLTLTFRRRMVGLVGGGACQPEATG